MPTRNATHRRVVTGIVLALATQGALLAVLVPFRTHLSIATAALAFVIPVVVGVVAGGFAAGALASVVGFVLYDVFFLPPYGTLTVHGGENWLALVVYLVVTLLVAQVVTNLNAARDEARRRGAGRRPAVRALPGPHRRIHHFGTARPHRRDGADRLRPALDRPAPARGDDAGRRPTDRALRGGARRSTDQSRGIDVAHFGRWTNPVAWAWPAGRRPVASRWLWWRATDRWVSWCSKRSTSPGRTEPCSEPSPTRQPWRSNGRSSRTKPCARACWRR